MEVKDLENALYQIEWTTSEELKVQRLTAIIENFLLPMMKRQDALEKYTAERTAELDRALRRNGMRYR